MFKVSKNDKTLIFIISLDRYICNNVSPCIDVTNGFAPLYIRNFKKLISISLLRSIYPIMGYLFVSNDGLFKSAPLSNNFFVIDIIFFY
ncbi:putative ankyrin repeat protein L371 [BeAn 58058 virus]|uniref:putative ankyrin repeat protein L371 n=1 Tax=BeAn 58058 virus TaxID=67082 RepID=UPI00090C8E21|nr:putative ankyrin repeat protein L371 [BeAn 58058 virus]APG58366.1 putative ankyrin repeat protein L371 [BeAn 58058 virus]